MMNSQIEKLTQKNKLFADEAVQREDELNDIIKSQEEIIRESRIKIDELQIIVHNLTSKPKRTTSTQTEANNSSSKLIPPEDKNKRIQVSNADQLIENVNKSAESLVLIDDFVPIQESSESEPLSPPRNKKTPANQINTKTEGSCDKKKSEVVNLIEKSHTGKLNDGLTLMEELENYEGSAAYSNNSDPHEERGGPVKLPPDFDLQSTNAASEWKFWQTAFHDYLVSTGQDQALSNVKLNILRNIIGHVHHHRAVQFSSPTSTHVQNCAPLQAKKNLDPYDGMLAEIEKYVNPRKNECFERYMFSRRQQKEGESFDHFLTDCRHLIKTCNYNTVDPNQSQVEKALRDRIVTGIKDPTTREALLRIDDLTLEKAIRFCRTSEQSKSQSLQFQESGTEVNIVKKKNKYQKYNKSSKSSKFNGTKNESGRNFKCKRCQTIHGPRECPAFGKKCSKCGIENHFAVSCRVKSVRNIEQSDASSSADSDDLFVNRVRKEKYTDREVSEDFCENLSIEKEKVKGFGRFPGKHNIPTKENFKNVCHPPSKIPFAIRDQLKVELNRLVDRKAIVKVDEISPEASINRIVIVEKSNGKIRLCLDPSDINCQIVRKPRLGLNIEEVCSNLRDKNYFTVFDLSEGYHHLELNDESSWKCCFATPFGVYRFIVLPYGLANSQDLFQDEVEKHFSNVQNVVICHDDMIVHGKTRQEHDLAVAEVVKRATEVGAKFNKDKFQYCQSQVKFMGQIFSRNGMQINSDKVESLCKLKTPTNRVELQRVIGSFNYVRRYVKNMSELMHPLCQLLRNNVEWLWLPKHQQAFDQLKEVITKTPALVPFDPEKQTVLQCDASKNGLGCCKNIQFADMLSRSSLQIKNSPDPDMFEMVHLVSSQEKKDQFRLETSKDSTLLRIHDYYYSGWPKEQRIPADCKPYYSLKDSIYVEAAIPKNLGGEDLAISSIECREFHSTAGFRNQILISDLNGANKHLKESLIQKELYCSTLEKLKVEIEENFKVFQESSITKKEFNAKIKEVMSKTLTANQVDIILDVKKRVRWNRNELSKAFTLRYLSKKAYLFMRNENFPLPHIRTFQKYSQLIDLRDGILKDVLQFLKIASLNMAPKEKAVVLLYDEMKVRNMYEYDEKSDEIIGPHDYVQVVIARSLFGNWKQPVYVGFDKNMSKELLYEIILALYDISFDVVAVVSDCGPSNQNTLKELNVSFTRNYFQHPGNNNKIFCFLDAPHLLKLIRNWLLKTGFILSTGKKVHKNILEDLISRTADTEVSSIFKLSEKYLRVEGAEKQNVTLASQLLSHSTATAIKRYYNTEESNNLEYLYSTCK
ncbi:hypothetical protein JTB14_012197 [Gonioctena quinquepunctata]|nr:hypothetical protein JTB14_012197 [Gonioctena quinquepunctata]